MEVESLNKALELIKNCCCENKYCKTCPLFNSGECVVTSSGDPENWVIKKRIEKEGDIMNRQHAVLDALQVIKTYCITDECKTCILYDAEKKKCTFYQNDKVPREWKNKAVFAIKNVEL